MKHFALVGIAILTAICLPLAAQSAVLPLLVDNFDADTTGTFPAGWSLSGTVAGTSATVGEDPGGSGNKWAVLHDDNGPNTYNNTLYRAFGAAVTSGTCTVQFDVYLPQDTAGFGTRLWSGISPPTTVGNNATGLVFQGNIGYVSGGGPGIMCYQKKSVITDPDAYVLFDPQQTYSPNTWYTVKVVANVDTRKYQIFFGPQGGPLSEITPAGGVDFIRKADGSQVTKIGGLTFFTSNKNGDGPGDLYIDNVYAEGDVTIVDVATCSAAKTTPNGTLVRIADKVVTGGTDQVSLIRPIFYIQDETGGIRVRVASGTTVHQGDKVTLVGTIKRASDNGTSVLRNGEKEINCAGITASVTVTPGPFPLPDPVVITNRQMGGGNFGPIDPDGYPAQPGVYKSGTSPNQVPEDGLNNVGRYARVAGKVVYSINDPTGRFFYFDDGSNVIDGSLFVPPGGTDVQKGVRCALRSLTGPIDGKFAVITGIVGAIAQGELNPGTGINNVRIIRPLGEPFTDVDGDGIWEDAEPFEDLDGNGAYTEGEPYTDVDGDGRYDAREPFTDSNGNGSWDSGIVFIP